MSASTATFWISTASVQYYNPTGRRTPAGLCDYDNAPPSCFSRQVPTMWLQKATLDANGITTSKVNLTDPDEGMGYIDVHPDGASVLFATERSNGDVETYILNLTSAGAAGQPAEFLSDISALVAPCKAVGCVDASTFHATWSYSGDEVFFAYRVWDQFGDGIGNQAIGKAARDGSGMTPLTFTTAGPDKGINIIDTCPAPVKGQTGQILFVRTEDQGASNYLAVADVTTGNVTLLTGLPQWAQASGCPNYVETADGLSVVYMACLNGGCDGPLAVRRQLLPVTRTRRGVDRAHAGMVTSSAQQGRKSGGDPHWAAWGMLPPSPDASTITKRVVAPNNTVLFAYFGVTMKAGVSGEERQSEKSCCEFFNVSLALTARVSFAF